MLCALCVEDLPWLPSRRCIQCAIPLSSGEFCGACLDRPPRFSRVEAAFAYAFPLDGLVQAFKYGGRLALAGLLGGQLGRAVTGRADAIVPMPLAPRRLAERGFNQALLLARRLGRAKVETQLLLRLRETGSQTALARRERQANVGGAFGVEPLRAGEVRQKHILLVDDVMTCGASLHAAAQALRQAGATRVAAVVLARTEEPS